MRIANVDGRATILGAEAPVDVYHASNGRFGPDPLDVYMKWDEFQAATDVFRSGVPTMSVPLVLSAPVPWPRQIFAVGLNYLDHATESGLTAPAEPMIFTKFATSLCGPDEVVTLPVGNVDWEVELVAVMGKASSHVPEDKAWSHVAGLMVGQDLSERASQFYGSTPQFSLSKSFAGFAPTGPAVVTLDEIADPDRLLMGCRLNGEDVQRSSTADMIFPIPELIARLSRVVTLLPGDLIFTGTPPGVGMGRTPQRFLAPGDQLDSYVDEVGTLRQRFASADESGNRPAARVAVPSD